MANVTLSSERWYVTADRTRAVKSGDPEAAFLLVTKGGAIAPEVAAHYGIETYSGEAIEKVTETIESVKDRMVTPGTSNETAKNYEAMKIGAEVRESVQGSLTTEGNRSAGRQGEMMAQSIIATKDAEGTLVPETAKIEEEPVGPASRTKDLGSPESETLPANEPPNPEKTQTGQGEPNPLEGLQELEDAQAKTL